MNFSESQKSCTKENSKRERKKCAMLIKAKKEKRAVWLFFYEIFMKKGNCFFQTLDIL